MMIEPRRAHRSARSGLHSSRRRGRPVPRLFPIVGDEDAGQVHFVMQAAQPAAQFLPDLGVERAEGLVEQQHRGFDGQRPRQATRWRWPPESCAG